MMRNGTRRIHSAYERMFGHKPPKDYTRETFKKTISKPNRGKRVKLRF